MKSTQRGEIIECCKVAIFYKCLSMRPLVVMWTYRKHWRDIQLIWIASSFTIITSRYYKSLQKR